jgi:VCBS repeat-containing protein
MLVASGVEFGDACMAAVGQLPQVIGNVQTAIGCGTIKRPSGMAVQAMVGDPVCQGDVIETAADGRIEIRFVDGTVFNLSRDTRVVLDEFARDSNGSLRSALRAGTRGTFAFMASRLATAGSLTVDAPVGSIRSRGQGGGIGMLSMAALIFSTMKEVQAADSNVTFLDDDTITYKDLDHGVFELITKEAIPRHIIVEDPGQTVVLSRNGSSVSVNEVTNSLTRMQELQAAQQDVLANFAKGLGPTGSSTPPFANPLPVEPINFIQTDALHGQNSLSPIEPMIFIVPETFIVRSPPTLNAPTGPTEIDTVVFDSFTDTSGTFSASSANGSAALTFSISGGTAGNTVLGGVTYDVSDTGPFGTLYVNSTTGAYTFAPNSGAINALQAPTTETFTITVSDGTLSASRAFTINIDGVNDAAIISGTAAGTAVEAGGVANATAHAPTATGTLTDTDVDNLPNTFTAVTSPTASAGGYGTFTMTADGVWTYKLDNDNGAVQALNVGDRLTDTFTVTTIDGTPQVVTITINGTNDAAIISGKTTGSVIEAGDDDDDGPGVPRATGRLTDTDVDNPPNTFMAVSSPTKGDGGYGTFTMTAAGVWTYTLDDANWAVRALHADDTLTDTFTVHTIDGTAQVVTITIHGASDDDHYDFGRVATATQVVADPPAVNAIPQHDSIVAAGNEGQIIDAAATATATGTGTADLVNPGSGNDTIKGNDGADTISGGSGSDTITASSGSGTHLGGHGPDALAGGNGNDRFVSLSATDSRAARFDSMSGSGRIDLSALGALDFVILALLPTSTSVPAHTIAWLYDSADNETIVYVNPTDQTLRIGASGLLEMHVQGIATIQASDFVPEPTVAAVAIAGEPIDHALAATAANDATIATMTTALVSSSTISSDDALHAVSNWTWQTNEEKLSFSSFDEGRTSATEHSDDAVVILASGHAVVSQHGPATEPMENNVTSDKAPVHVNADSTPIGNGAVTPPSGTINYTDITALKTPAEPSHVEAEPSQVEKGAAPEGGGSQSHSDENRASETSDVTTANNKVHSKDHSKFEHHSVSKDHSDLKEHSEAVVTNTSPADAAETHMHRPETAGKLVMGDSFKFKDELPGHKAPDVIDLGPEDHTSTSISHHENSTGPHGLLEISETQTIELSPSGHHSADHFSIDPHHAGGVVATHVQHDLIV